DLQFFESFDFEDLAQENGHAIVRPQADAGETEASEVAELENRGDLFQFLRRDPAAICRPDAGPDACPGDVIDGDALFLHHFDHADVGKSPSETSAERQADLRTRLGRPRLRMSRPADLSAKSLQSLRDLVQLLHGPPARLSWLQQT